MRCFAFLIGCLLSACGPGLYLEVPPIASETPSETNGTISFVGVTLTLLTASGRMLVRWNAATVTGGSATYKIYSGASAGAVNTLEATVTSGTEAFITAPALSTAYIRVVASVGTVDADGNTVASLSLDKTSTHPILTGTATTTAALDDVYAHDVTQALNAYGTRPDSRGNIYWFDFRQQWKYFSP